MILNNAITKTETKQALNRRSLQRKDRVECGEDFEHRRRSCQFSPGQVRFTSLVDLIPIKVGTDILNILDSRITLCMFVHSTLTCMQMDHRIDHVINWKLKRQLVTASYW